MKFKEYLNELSQTNDDSINEANTVFNKTTVNYARKRGIELEHHEKAGDKEDVLYFYPLGSDDEPMVAYTIKDSGQLFFRNNIWLKRETKEELPHWIKDEKELRRVIDFLGQEIKSDPDYYA